MRPVSWYSSCLLVPKARKVEELSSSAGAQGLCGGKTCSFVSFLWVGGMGKAPEESSPKYDARTVQTAGCDVYVRLL